jgi:hypothetical protein
MDGSIGEVLVRATLEEAFPGCLFGKTRRPMWLGGLELDCYNENLRLAAEYQGIQHYEFTPFFHDNDPARFVAQMHRDERKREYVHDAWVTLLEIPYTVHHSQIRAHVRRELVELGYDIAPDVIPNSEFVAAALENGQLGVVMLAKACAIATSHGGSCLSTDYVNCHEPLQFVCAQGHAFETPLASVNAADHPRPRYCPECGGTRRRTLEENQALIAPSGYTLLDIDSVIVGLKKSVTRFTIRCPADHEYTVLRDNFLPVLDGVPKRGCIRCARLRTNRERGAAIREARLAEFGLEALEEYKPRHKAAKWRCLSNGHEFEASWNSVNARRGSKCLACARPATQ